MSTVEVFDTRDWIRLGRDDVEVTVGRRDGVPMIDIALTGALAETVWRIRETAAIRWFDQVWTIEGVSRDGDGRLAVCAINWEKEMQRCFDAQYGLFRRYDAPPYTYYSYLEGIATMAPTLRTTRSLETQITGSGLTLAGLREVLAKVDDWSDTAKVTISETKGYDQRDPGYVTVRISETA